MRFLAFLVIGVLVVALPASAAPSRCGGDGPQPFNDISVGVPKATRIPLQGSVSDFIYWDNADTIVYRNERNQIHSKALPSKWEGYFGNSAVGLSPVVDPREDSILLDRIPYLFAQGYWFSFYVGATSPKHLFWEGNFLYMLENVPAVAGSPQQLQSHRYRRGFNSARYLCQYLVPAGETYLQAEGAEFPVVPFYKVRPTAQGNELSIYEMDVRSCNMTWYGTYKEMFEGKILSVHRFASLNSYAIQIDHPTKNLMWDFHSGCEFYDVGPGVLFPTHSRPIVASWSAATGLEVMNLTTKNRGYYEAGVASKSVRARDALMGRVRDKFFLAAEDDQGRQLYELDVKDVLH